MGNDSTRTSSAQPIVEQMLRSAADAGDQGGAAGHNGRDRHEHRIRDGEDLSMGADVSAESRVEPDFSQHPWYTQGLRYSPYPLLLVSVLISTLQPNMSTGTRMAVLGLSGAAVLWTWALVTRGQNKVTGARMYVYFAGFLVFAGLLMTLDMLFFVYTISGFLHAVTMRPVWAGVTAVFFTSVWINLGTMAPLQDWSAVALFALVVVIQTAAIASSIPLQDRMDAQHEKRRKTVIKLEEALEQNAELQAQVLDRARESGALAERQRMAREIHDTLAQGLAGIVTQLEAADHARQESDQRRHLDNAVRLARDSLGEARRTVHAVAPAELEEARLSEAVGQVADGWAELHRVPVEMVTTGSPQALHPEVEVTLLRIAQEALTNVGKHAAATRVGLTLSYMGDVVTLDIRDDGRGFDPARMNGERYVAPARSDRADEPVGGFGMTGMRHRAHRLSGRFEVETEPGGGTAVSVRVPAIPPGEVSI